MKLTTKARSGETWFTVSVDGLKKTLARNGLFVAMYVECAAKAVQS